MESRTTFGTIYLVKTFTYRRLFCLRYFLSVFLSLFSQLLLAQSPIEKIESRGLKNSDPQWFESLVNIDLPNTVTDYDLEKLRNRILATGIFSYVNVSLQGKTLYIQVEEKWTLIPVLRAKSGGGTPLFVLGGYESNFLGRQWILGAELRKYKHDPVGALAYTQVPNLLGQRTLVAAEVSKIFRTREIYEGRELLGHLKTDEQSNKLQFLFPTPLTHPNLRFGGDLRYFKLRVSLDNTVPQAETFTDHNREYKALAVVDYDSLVVDTLLYDGIRSKNKFGMIFGRKGTHAYPLTELELFYYKTFQNSAGFALHGFLAASDSKALQAQYFLGGFDSVRGIPDGAIWGNKAFYTNTELLYLFFKSHYVWLQSSFFFDYGEAAQQWGNLRDSRKTSFGAGLRLAVPQIYRMVVRVDLAWNVETGSKGVSLGFNQFFQPYTPSLSP